QATAEYGRFAGMALPLIMAPITLVSSLSIVLIPDVAGLRAQGKMSELRGKLSTLTLFSLIVAATFFALYLPLGEGLGELLFKDAEAGKYVSYCSALLFPVALANATTPMLNSLGKEKNTLVSTVAGGIVSLPLILLTKVVGSYAVALTSGTCFLVTAILNCIVLHKEIGAFADVKKCLTLIVLFVPLAVTGYFANRLLGTVVGNLTSIIVISVYTLFFAFLLTNAFNIVDIVGFLRLLKPVKSLSHSKKHSSCKKRVKKRIPAKV
ncbi:MAG: polysaccharide biosynthesis C-terminal domain-containing protein, partial [Clostridia bacterium]|nr:polysaccharide biosynthesis C-terminal domain-containing protein [Clostridia bacterium]